MPKTQICYVGGGGGSGLVAVPTFDTEQLLIMSPNLGCWGEGVVSGWFLNF